MDLSHMTRQEIEALLKMLAEMERQGSNGCIDNLGIFIKNI